MEPKATEKRITLFPANWLFNAGVIGFLTMIKTQDSKLPIESWFREDGSVEIDPAIFDQKTTNGQKQEISLLLTHYSEYHKTQFQIASNVILEGIALPSILKGNTKLYKNFINPSTQIEEAAALNKLIMRLSEYSISLENNPNAIPCNMCTEYYEPVTGSNDLSRFLEDHQILSTKYGTHLGAAQTEFPNAFWNMEQSIHLCPLCIYFLIHHHIPFFLTSGKGTMQGGFFVNSHSFKAMWYMNRYTAAILSNSYDLRTLLGLKMLELSHKINMTLGAWSMMNIELIAVTGSGNAPIEYYRLPHKIASIIAQKDIASLIFQTQDPLVLELILKGHPEQLSVLHYEIMRNLFATPRRGGAQARTDFDLFSRLTKKNQEPRRLDLLLTILPRLYAKVIRYFKEAV